MKSVMHSAWRVVRDVVTAVFTHHAPRITRPTFFILHFSFFISQ